MPAPGEPLPLVVERVELARTPCRTRQPFRFGTVTVHEADLLTCRAHCRSGDGRQAVGWSADLLVPRWFRKDLRRTPAEDAEALWQSGAAAAEVFTRAACQPRPLFDAWWETFQGRVMAPPPDDPDLLERGFGVALVERAAIDAACRLGGLPFAEAIRADLFGFRPGMVHGSLGDWDWRASLPRPSPVISLRHTVGMLDPLSPSDVQGGGPGDGLPGSLEEDITQNGLTWFKVKIGGGHLHDRQRLLRLARLFADLEVPADITLDGNEQFADLDELAALLEAVAKEPLGSTLLERLHWVEQPLARQHTFDADRHRALARVTAFAPLILDEADALPWHFPRALELGYRGTSMKNCKGVFRALCSFGMSRLAEGHFLAGEDLTNLPLLALQQDLCTAAVLGLPHVERNGHHYFRGLDHLSPDLQRAAQAAHGDLYRPLDGATVLRIEAGRLHFPSALKAMGYGHALEGHAGNFVTVAGG